MQGTPLICIILWYWWNSFHPIRGGCWLWRRPHSDVAQPLEWYVWCYVCVVLLPTLCCKTPAPLAFFLFAAAVLVYLSLKFGELVSWTCCAFQEEWQTRPSEESMISEWEILDTPIYEGRPILPLPLIPCLGRFRDTRSLKSSPNHGFGPRTVFWAKVSGRPGGDPTPELPLSLGPSTVLGIEAWFGEILLLFFIQMLASFTMEPKKKKTWEGNLLSSGV